MNNNKKEKASLKESIIWALKMLGASWGAWLISIVPLYIFRGLYNYDATRLFWEEVIMSVLGTIFSSIIIYIFAVKADEFERADTSYVKSLAIKSSVIYGIICVVSMGYYPLSVIASHIARFITYLIGGKLYIAALIIASTILNTFFAFAIIKGSKRARKRRQKYVEDLLGENKNG
ncbi:MAG: hypothetical protein E7675_01185 [Ruminococcaceae bacterium]|nr:hypothetical protein [Oscillospiraceae bacterium]